MAVVDVRPVGVGVHEAVVDVGVAVSGGRGEARVLVEVVAVVVAVAVDVLRRLVDVLVGVLAPEERRDRGGEQDAGSRVLRSEALAQQREGEHRAHEGGGREDALGAGGADLVSGGDVERDAGTVGQDAHDQRRSQGVGRRDDRCEREPDREVRAPGNEALDEGAARGRDAVDQRREVVVEAPARARERDQQGGLHTRPAAASGEQRAAGHDARNPEPSEPAQVLAEEGDTEHGRRHHLQVEEQRHRAGAREPQAEEEEHRPENAPEQDGPAEAERVAAIERHARPPASLPDHDRRHSRGRSQVEEACELEGPEGAEEPLARRRGGAKEQGGQESEREAVHVPSPQGFRAALAAARCAGNPERYPPAGQGVRAARLGSCSSPRGYLAVGR